MTTEIRGAPGASGPECAVFAPLLPIIDEATIDPGARAAAEAHMMTCPYCAARLLAYDRLDAALRRHFGAESAWAASAAIDTSVFDGDEPPMFILEDAPEGSMRTDQGRARTPSTIRSGRWPATSRRPNARLAAFGAIAAVLLLALLAGALFVRFAAPARQPTTTPDGRVAILFTLPFAAGVPRIAAGPDGNVWFADNGSTATKLGRITPDGKIAEYPLPASAAAIRHDTISSLAAGPDGAIWFLHAGTIEDSSGATGSQAISAIWTLDRASPTGIITEFPLTPAGGDATLVGGRGGALWLLSTAKRGGLPADARITQVTNQDHFFVTRATVGPDGNLWGPLQKGKKIGRLTPDGALATFPLADPQLNAYWMALGPDGALWFSEIDGNNGQPPTRGAIGRVTPSGVVTDYPAPQGTLPWAIAAGPDGRLWVVLFTPQASERWQLGRITPGGEMTRYPLPDGQEVGQLIAGPDGNLWFVFLDARGNSAIGRYRLH